MFESLTKRMTGIFERLRMRGKLTREHVEAGLDEVRRALLEADVAYSVVRDFIARVGELAVGEETLKGIRPTDQIVKIVHDELVEMMGPAEAPLDLAPPGEATVLMLCGLQGSGKTTTCAKLAKLLAARGRKPMLVAADVQRPAAIEQLQILGARMDLPVHAEPGAPPPALSRRAVQAAKMADCDTVLIDTAGRLHVDEAMMDEVVEVAAKTKPREVLFVCDAMTGQDAVRSAAAFAERLALTGVVLTKLDGDARGGAALSVRAVTGAPVKFVGVGEKLEDLESFHPDRMAGRILGMGDVVSLVEKAQAAVDQEEAAKIAGKMFDGSMTLEDFLGQLRQVKKMGSLQDMVAMIPGLSGQLGGEQVDEREFGRMEAIVSSMTREERRHPEILDGSRRRRVASGSGTRPQNVNALLKQFTQMKKMFSRPGRLGQLLGGLGGLGQAIAAGPWGGKPRHGRGRGRKKKKRRR